jgi:hypothetical protein
MELGQHAWAEGVDPLIFFASFDDISLENKTSIPLPQIP